MNGSVEMRARTLQGQKAIKLWQGGHTEWNEWVKKNPSGRVEFSHLDFSEIIKVERWISFDNFHFPNGGASFKHVSFGDYDVSFINTDFGRGEVSFEFCDFGKGDVFFSRVMFKTDKFSFFCVNFGEGDIVLNKVNLLRTEIRFERVSACGEFIISPDNIELERFKMLRASIDGPTLIDFRFNVAELSYADFRGTAFKGPLEIAGKFDCIPDFRGTNTDHHVDLSGLEHKLNRESKWSWPKWLHFIDPSYIVTDSEDRARLQRLKELAEANRDHTAALRFAADENRAARWKDRGWFASTLDLAFSAVSNYGQSIARPFTTLVVFGIACAAAFFWMSDKAVNEAFGFWGKLGEAGLLSLGNTVAFIPQTRTIREDALKHLYGMDANVGVDALIIAQAVGAFILLFLIGLGIRNRFRL